MIANIKVCTCILIGFLCFDSSLLLANSVVPKYPLFQIDSSNIGQGDFVDNAVFMTLNKEVLQLIRHSQLDELDAVIPFENGQRLTLALKKESFLAKDFKIQVQEHSCITTLPYTPALFYSGKVKGIPNTLVALNFFEEEISGIISINGDNYNIGRYERGGKDSFVLYKEKNLDIPNPFECSTKDPASIQIGKTSSSRSGNTNKVRLYVECDHFIYQHMNKNTPRVAAYATGLLNIIATIYRKESIELEISEIKIWSSPDPYPIANAQAAKDAFSRHLNGNFNGDIAHLISNYIKNDTPPNGGSANIDVLCNKPKAVSYSNITTTYLHFPIFSWTVFAIAHEIGHNLGSVHTHSCLWPTGPIDNCWCPEGSCETGPELRSSGTLMSYCYLDPSWATGCVLSITNPGIDLAAGFGPQPSALIKNRINEASCLIQNMDTTKDSSDSENNEAMEESSESQPEVNIEDEVVLNNDTKDDDINNLTIKNNGIRTVRSPNYVNPLPEIEENINDFNRGPIIDYRINHIRTIPNSSNTIAINSLEVKDISCDGQADGEIKVTVIGGVPPYQLVWSNGVVGPINTNLDEGSYSLEVFDAIDASRIFYFTLSNSNMEVTTSILEDEVTISVSGGQPAYTFDWNNGRSNSHESNLEQGDFMVTITDANGCQVIESITVASINPQVNTLIVSPNPADTYFNIYYELETAQIVFVSIINEQGQFVYGINKFTDLLQETLPIADWKNGTYYIQVLQKTKKTTTELKVVHN